MDDEEEEYIITRGFEPGMAVLVKTDEPDLFVGNLVSTGLTGICTHKTHRLEEVPVEVSEESTQTLRDYLSGFHFVTLKAYAIKAKVGLNNVLKMPKDELVEACLNKEIRRQVAEIDSRAIVPLSTPILTYTPWERITVMESAEDYNDEVVLRELDFAEPDEV